MLFKKKKSIFNKACLLVLKLKMNTYKHNNVFYENQMSESSLTLLCIVWLKLRTQKKEGKLKKSVWFQKQLSPPETLMLRPT